MAIAHDIADPAARTRVNHLLKVGFSPRQAFALEAGSWTVNKLSGRGLFARYTAKALTAVSPTVADLIKKGKLTHDQAVLVKSYYLT